MTCNDCRNEINEHPFHILKCIVGNLLGDLFLCPGCFFIRTAGEAEIIGSMGDDIIVYNEGMSAIAKEFYEVPCPNCSTSLNDINTNGLFGCEECYVNFCEMINIAEAKGCQNIKKDKPKNIDNNFEGNKDEARKRVLKQQLKQAEEKENYEKCAEIRDELAKIDQEGKQ